MSLPDLEPLQESLNDRVTELETKQEQAEKQYEGDGSTAAVWRKVSPKIRRDVVEDCLRDLEVIEDIDELFGVLAEWRRDKNQEWVFNRNNGSAENERNNIKRAEIRNWISDLEELIPDSEFETCGRCSSLQMPKSDRRGNIEYRWECPECY